MGKLTVIVWLAVVLTPALVRSVELVEEDGLQELEGGSEQVFLEESPRTEKLLRLILGDAFSKYKPNPKPVKRICYLNGGMAHSCDYSDVVNAARHDKFWRDPEMPGRRRRSPRLPFNKRVKRCANLLDDSCINGQYPGSGGDGDYFGSGGSPGKRSLPPLLEIFKNQMNAQRKNRRCANLLDDSCINGQYPGAGGDGDYFGSGGSPGKRSAAPLVTIYQNKMDKKGQLVQRCANLLDDSCINGQYPGAGGDGDYFGSGGSPGKRSPPPLLEIFKNEMEAQGKHKRCANLLDDSCINGQYPGSGGDGDYFGSGGSPGKRSLSVEQVLEYNCLRGHAASCSLLRM